MELGVETKHNQKFLDGIRKLVCEIVLPKEFYG